ncbi:MAG: serine/threonine protein kinase [Deltaproteobacteria bacterium]|nr:serine/threonine protein kinase [Deltaproteobacteria bacterium]
MFGLVAGVGGLVFLAFRVVMVLVGGSGHSLLKPDMLTHAAGSLSMLAMWAVCRRGEHSARAIRTVETVGLVSGSVAYELMGMTINPFVRPEMTVLMALTFGLVARAVTVPSTPRRTTWLGVAIGIPLLVTTYLNQLPVDTALVAQIYGHTEEKTVHALATYVTMNTAVWWALAVAVCRVAAKVVYGLRTEVRDIRRLGQYTLEEKLGEGGMGVVYRARHAMLKRPTAVKLLPADKAGERALERFEREVQITAALTHPNTVRIFDYGRTPEGVFYYVMELLDGAALDDLVAIDGPLPPGRVVHILDQAAGALAEAHELGLIHRDIKPANIMVLEQGGAPDVAKVLDFGLVKDVKTDSDTLQTRTDVVTGTPQYLSPEAIEHPSQVDARSDLYALGAVGYFLLTGQHVFEEETVVAVCTAHLHKEPIPPAERLGREPIEGLDELLLQCLEKSPDRRPQTAGELQQALRAVATATPWSPSDGKAWWSEHGEAVRERRQQHFESATGGTIAIDLARRS